MTAEDLSPVLKMYHDLLHKDFGVVETVWLLQTPSDPVVMLVVMVARFLNPSSMLCKKLTASLVRTKDPTGILPAVVTYLSFLHRAP